MPFIAVAAIEALRRFPIVNASLIENSIHYHANINLGIAVALEWGLIVPVVREAEQRSFLSLARSINDLAARARTKKLCPMKSAAPPLRSPTPASSATSSARPSSISPSPRSSPSAAPQRARRAHRRGRQRHHRHPLHAALLPWLRPPPHRRRRRRQIHAANSKRRWKRGTGRSGKTFAIGRRCEINRKDSENAPGTQHSACSKFLKWKSNLYLVTPRKLRRQNAHT